MSIAEQIAILKSIQIDLRKELSRTMAESVQSGIQAQIDGLDWSIKTLQEIKLMRQSIKYLLEVG